MGSDPVAQHQKNHTIPKNTVIHVKNNNFGGKIVLETHLAPQNGVYMMCKTHNAITNLFKMGLNSPRNDLFCFM